MAELFELRGRSAETTAEPLRRKVSRLRTNAYTGVAYTQVPKDCKAPIWAPQDIDTSFTLPFFFDTAPHSAEPQSPCQDAQRVELRERLETLQALRNAFVHYQRPSQGFSEALRDIVSELELSFAKLSQFEIEEDETSKSDIRVRLDEFDSADRFQVLKQEIATATMFTGSAEEERWTEAKNKRRCELVDSEIDGTLSSSEKLELQRLQAEMLACRRELAPLPLDEVRKLHQALIRKAAKAHEEE